MYVTPDQRNNSSAVVGAVLGTLTVVLIVTVTITVTVLFVLSWRVSLTMSNKAITTLCSSNLYLKSSIYCIGVM